MFYISVTKIGSICKTCVGIYLSSLVLAGGAFLAYRALSEPAFRARPGRWLLPPIWAALLLVSTLCPLRLCVAIPDERPTPQLRQARETESKRQRLVKMKNGEVGPHRDALETRLCRRAARFTRMVAEGAFDRLDVQMALFPLDSPSATGC